MTRPASHRPALHPGQLVAVPAGACGRFRCEEGAEDGEADRRAGASDRVGTRPIGMLHRAIGPGSPIA